MPGSPHPDPSHPAGAAGGYPSTRLESVEEIQRAIRARAAPAPSATPPAVPTAPPPAETPVFRPVRRPPMALLCVHDDGNEDGEVFRLRTDRVVIGRSEGDIVIPHDTMMSGRHADLSRQLEEGRPRWFLTDLQSTNGTYVRASHAILKPGQDLLLGSRRYRFLAALQDLHTAETEDPPPKGTQGWQSVTPADLTPSLVELVNANDTGRRYPLPHKEQWLGRDPRMASIVIPDDPLISPRHARIYQGRKRWHIENAGSVNGIWLRVQHLALESTCYFQLGEQRFSVRIP
jgi:hypothetical protein